MKYIPLSSLQNSYSSISKYRTEQNGVSIDGFYKENSLNIPTLDFENIGVINNTSFRFIVRIFDNQTSKSVLNTFTSQGYYDDLVRAKNNLNPYFINTALNPDTFIKIYLDKLRNTFDSRRGPELADGVSVVFNNLFNGDGSVDYDRFGRYLDWVVSQPNLNDIVDNGVLESSRISSFNINPDLAVTPDFEDVDTETEGGSSNTSGGTDIGGSGGNIEVPDTNDIIDPTDRVDIDDSIIIDGEEFPITPLPRDIVGGSPVGGEGEQGNLPVGGNQGNRDPFRNPGGNPDEDIANEYTTRYRNTNREL